MPNEPASRLPGRDELVTAYRTMRTIREFEERLHEEFPNGAIPGAVHLYAGQEAIATGVCGQLRETDFIASTHRGHGHAIAKGADLTAMMLEIYGKAGGLCRGKGGSMHIADFDHGMLGANGVAAGGVPMVCGSALTAKVTGSGAVSVAFVGDGGANQGAFAESLNLAAVWQLPCVFVVEDNGYAQATGTRFHLDGRDVAPRGESFGIPSTVVDGYDFFAVRDAALSAVELARDGGGPSLLDCKAYRFFGHMEGWDAQAYRPAGEVARLRAERDCVQHFVDRVTAERALSPEDIESVDLAVGRAVTQAVEVAVSAKDPDLAELLTDVYVSY